MNRLRPLGALMALSAVALAGCSQFSTREAPEVTPKRIDHVFVEHRLSDGRNLDELIAADLRSRGYDASCGPLTMMPAGEDAIVSYQDTWTFDFTTYMIELDVSVRDARTDAEIATGRYFHPSVTGTKPAKMVSKVLDQIFQPHVPPVKTILPPPSD
jgi:hypothetical protein